jgi:hypothetical protein
MLFKDNNRCLYRESHETHKNNVYYHLLLNQLMYSHHLALNI